MTLTRALNDLGIYPTVRRGRPSLYANEEEALQMKKIQMRAAQSHRRQLLQEAAAAGLPPPTFKRGRPRIYETQEEARSAQRRMNKVCIARQKERLKEASQTLVELVAAGKIVRSTDEPQNVLLE